MLLGTFFVRNMHLYAQASARCVQSIVVEDDFVVEADQDGRRQWYDEMTKDTGE